jgi:hypothetical protein
MKLTVLATVFTSVAAILHPAAFECPPRPEILKSVDPKFMTGQWWEVQRDPWFPFELMAADCST